MIAMTHQHTVDLQLSFVDVSNNLIFIIIFVLYHSVVALSYSRLLTCIPYCLAGEAHIISDAWGAIGTAGSWQPNSY